jgi:hypothetical protein
MHAEHHLLIALSLALQSHVIEDSLAAMNYPVICAYTLASDHFLVTFAREHSAVATT